MVSRIKELEELILKGRPKNVGPLRAFQQYMAGEGNLTNTEKRKLKALQRRAKKRVEAIDKPKPKPKNNKTESPSNTSSKSRKLSREKNLIDLNALLSDKVLDKVSVKGIMGENVPPVGPGSTKPLPSSKKSASKKVGTTGIGTRSGVQTGRKGSTAVGTTGMGVRSGTKTRTTKRESSVKDVAPLGGSSYKIKSGDTLSAIARRNNTTVAALMRMNPKIKNKDKISAGQFIKVGSPERAKAKAKATKSSRGDPTSVAEAKRRGMDYYVVMNSKGKKVRKAAVTAAELKKSGLTLREYLNKMKKKK